MLYFELIIFVINNKFPKNIEDNSIIIERKVQESEKLRKIIMWLK